MPMNTEAHLYSSIVSPFLYFLSKIKINAIKYTKQEVCGCHFKYLSYHYLYVLSIFKHLLYFCFPSQPLQQNCLFYKEKLGASDAGRAACAMPFVILFRPFHLRWQTAQQMQASKEISPVQAYTSICWQCQPLHFHQAKIEIRGRCKTQAGVWLQKKKQWILLTSLHLPTRLWWRSLLVFVSEKRHNLHAVWGGDSWIILNNTLIPERHVHYVSLVVR